MAILFNKVVIIGVGLIGGSLGLAGRGKGLFGEVVGVGRNKTNLETALKMGAVDRYQHDPADACSDADLIVLATPVERMLSIGKGLVPHLRKGACLTDVGSVKEALVNGLEGVMPSGVRFVGGHPIAGSEESGASAAASDLFEGARTILTPTPSTDPEALRDLRSLWEGVGSTVLEMDAAEHDSLLAAVSHLPHMVAYALVSTLVEMQDERPDISSFAAGGFKDITRIASSHPEMWTEICQVNGPAIVEMIERYGTELKRIKDQIKAGNFEALTRTFEKARKFRGKC